SVMIAIDPSDSSDSVSEADSLLPRGESAMCGVTLSGDGNHTQRCYNLFRHMRSPYGLNIIDDCVACPVREERLFCNLSVPVVQKLNEIKSTALYPKSAVLFIEGQRPRGVFVLCTGKAKLSTSSSEGKTIITKISRPGDVLGLNATISDHPYEVTAEM